MMEESGTSNDFDIESCFLDGLVSLEMGSKKEKIGSKLDRKTELNQKEGSTLQSRTQPHDLFSARNNDNDEQADKVSVSHALEHRFSDTRRMFRLSEIGLDSTSITWDVMQDTDYNDAIYQYRTFQRSSRIYNEAGIGRWNSSLNDVYNASSPRETRHIINDPMNENNTMCENTWSLTEADPHFSRQHEQQRNDEWNPTAALEIIKHQKNPQQFSFYSDYSSPLDRKQCKDQNRRYRQRTLRYHKIRNRCRKRRRRKLVKMLYEILDEEGDIELDLECCDGEFSEYSFGIMDCVHTIKSFLDSWKSGVFRRVSFHISSLIRATVVTSVVASAKTIVSNARQWTRNHLIPQRNLGKV